MNDDSLKGIQNIENHGQIEKKLPILFEKKENCCGCSACYAICPVHAISMDYDQEGFMYPLINSSVCIRCYKCISVCAFKKDQDLRFSR